MSAIRLAPRAAALLRRRGVDPRLLGWQPSDRAATLGVATVGECSGLLEHPPAALLLLARSADVPPRCVCVQSGQLPYEVAFAPFSMRALQRRTGWLLQRVEATAPGERAAAEPRLHQLAVAGRLAATVAHEMGNALACSWTNAKFVTDALDRGNLQDPDVAEAALQARDGIRQALEAQRLVLELSRDVRPAAIPLDLNPVVERTVKLARDHAGRGLRLESELAVLPRVLADGTALAQVMMNLLLNAADAAGPGGRVLVRTRLAGGSVVISVADSGPGISPEVARELFQPFASGRSDRGGTGLGLMLSRQLVLALGGTIEAGTGPLGGAEFRVFLRTAQGAAVEAVSASGRRPAAP